MNFDKESKSRKKIAVGGGGGSYGRYEHESRHILYTQHIVTTSTEPYSFMKIILTVFKIALQLKNQEEITQKVCKQELSFLFATHCHDLFYITVKYHDNIPKGI